MQRLVLVVADRGDQVVELLAQLAQQVGDGSGVGAEDLLPQCGVAGRDPGDVADALSGQREVLGRCAGEAAGHQDGSEVRQVRRARDRLVVLVRAEGGGDGTTDRDQLGDGRRGLRRTTSCAG